MMTQPAQRRRPRRWRRGPASCGHPDGARRRVGNRYPARRDWDTNDHGRAPRPLLRHHPRPGGRQLRGGGGHRLRAAGPQRRRQDHLRPHPHDPAPRRRRPRPGRRLRRHRPGARGADQDRRHRPDRDHGRAAHRGREPRDHRALLPPGSRHVAAARPGAARAVRPRRRRPPAGEALLGRDAAAPRPRRQPDPRSRGSLPRRAHHRPGPGQPRRDVGVDPRPGLRGHHGAADHPVPGRGRPARRHHRGHRSRPGGGGGDPGTAQGVDRPALRPGHPAGGGPRGAGAGPAAPRRRGRGARKVGERARAATAWPPSTRWWSGFATLGVPVHEVGLEHPSLDEVFSAVTDHSHHPGAPDASAEEGGA